LQDEDDAIATDKFLVQLTPAPANFSASNQDSRELIQQLIQAWTNVDRKDKYEFRLRVSKRKNFAGQTTPTKPSQHDLPSLSPSQAAAANFESGVGDEAQLRKEVDKLKLEYQAL